MKLHKLLPLLLFASSAFAQTNGGTGKGLDKLDEQDVMSMLAANNLNTLLNREFDVYKVTPEQQSQLATLPLLKQLENPVGLTVARRRDLAVKVAQGLDAQLPKARDSATVLEQANQLFANGVLPDQTELEYFGENPVGQAQLKPVAETDKKMFDRAHELASDEMKALGNKIKTQAQFQQMQPQMKKLRMTKSLAEYTGNMVTYSLCLSLPKDDPQRKVLADKAIEYLKQYDNAESEQQPIVRLQIGKLQLVSGDYAAAKETLDTVVDVEKKLIVPSPAPADQNNARYFSIVAEILSHKLPAAETDIGAFDSWEKQIFLPQLSPSEQSEVTAAMAMMKFRLYTAQSDLSNDDKVKKDKNDQAMDVLATLLKDQPWLKDLVFDQLVARVPANADLSGLNPLILQGLRQQGLDEVRKPGSEKADAKKLQRAIDASAEIVNRKGQPGIDPADVDLSAYFIGYAYERLDQPKQATGAFLDYAQKFNANKQWGETSLDHATVLIFDLRKKDVQDADTRALYDRFLPVVINPPFNRKTFAFRYASLLKDEHKFKEAVDYFRMVPQTSKQYPEAQYLQMAALTQELGTPGMAPDARKEIVSQILDLTKAIDGLLAGATTDENKKTYVEWVVVADWIAADFTRRELKDPARALQLLEGFEGRIAGAKDPAAAHLYALQVRINAYLDQGKIDDATKTLFALLAENEAQGEGLMFKVSGTIRTDMQAAKAAGNVADEKKLALDQAQLTSLILDWATKSKDPKVQAELPIYQRFSADSKREAAELADDPATKQKELTEALTDYQALNRQQPDNLAAQQGIGLVQFDLGNYEQAIHFLAPLVNGKKVGQPFTIEGSADTEHEVENTDYWQANYELVKSLVELARKNPADPKSQQNLKDARSYVAVLYVTYGKKTGGTTYHDEFENLRSELAK